MELLKTDSEAILINDLPVIQRDEHKDGIYRTVV